MPADESADAEEKKRLQVKVQKLTNRVEHLEASLTRFWAQVAAVCLVIGVVAPYLSYDPKFTDSGTRTRLLTAGPALLEYSRSTFETVLGVGVIVVVLLVVWALVGLIVIGLRTGTKGSRRWIRINAILVLMSAAMLWLPRLLTDGDLESSIAFQAGAGPVLFAIGALILAKLAFSRPVYDMWSDEF